MKNPEVGERWWVHVGDENGKLRSKVIGAITEKTVTLGVVPKTVPFVAVPPSAMPITYKRECVEFVEQIKDA